MALLLLICLGRGAPAAVKQSSGFRIKIAFVFNFLKFTEWPEARSSGKIIVGVIGNTPLAEGTVEVPDAKVGERSVFITVIPSWSETGSEAQDALLEQCHALFICESARAHTGEILDRLKGKPILTVGESDTFLEQGGVFNFFIEDKKVRFNANLKAAKESGIKIRAKLLRLARDVTQ